MYEKFTDRARETIQLANQEAQRLNHKYIGTEHILVGLLKKHECMANRILVSLGADIGKLMSLLKDLAHPGPDVVSMGMMPQTPRAKKVIEYAMEEARNLSHNYVGTEHLLLGLWKMNEGISASVLGSLAVPIEMIREKVTEATKTAELSITPNRIRSVLRDYAEPGLVFSTDKRLTPEQLSQVVEEIKTQHQKAEQSGRPIIVHEPMTKSQSMEFGIWLGEIWLTDTRDRVMSFVGFGAAQAQLALSKKNFPSAIVAAFCNDGTPDIQK